MYDAKLMTLEETFKSEFFIDRFVRFTREFFNNIMLVSPLKENDHIYAEYKFSIASYTHVATYTDEEKKRMGIFAIKLQNNRSVERSRGIQRSFVSKLLDLGNLDAALVAFYCEDDPVWRLSFVRLDYEFVSGRAMKNLTPAKRYSYLVGSGEPCHTAVEQLYPIFRDDQYNPTIDKIETAFSIQSVTDKFFKEYKEKYLDVKEFLDKSADFNEQASLHHFTSEQFAKKLMGQIAFLYFIQKKGWLGVKAIPSKINKKEYEKAYYKFGKSSREVVSKLFVQTCEDEYTFNLTAFKDFSEDQLNVAGECFEPEPWGTGSKRFMYDMFEAYDDKDRNYFNEFLEPLFYDALNRKRGGNQYYSNINKRIPFLNGGLFQPIDNYDWKRNDFSIPNNVFSNKKIAGREADGILDVFGRYNFTVNENEPFESEVAVDPEMLGKIFENLLDVSDRKSKGTFYTPREIVSYMCKASLINFLANKISINYEDIEEFILYGEVMRDYDCSKEGKESENLQIPKDVYDHLQDIDDALKNVKIADPAVGSGAFPLGIVNEIVRIRTNITHYIARKLSLREARALHTGERHTYWLKRKAIESSIYAVDIDESAVDIAKLRLWLSLVVDDEINPDADSNTILETAKRDPHTLPNLDCHILCGNSLIDEIDGIKLFNESILYKEGESDEWQVASFMQSQYDVLLQQLFDAQDAVYSADSLGVKEELKAKIKVLTDKLIKINLNPELGVSAETIEKYEESIENDSKPYFLWKLEFGKVFRDNGGFDIVIGNPPYVDSENMVKNMPQFREDCNRNYKSARGNWDLFVPFVEAGYNFSNKSGVVSFIIPNKIIAADYATAIRSIMASNKITVIRDYSSVNVFKEAAVYPVTFISNKASNMQSVEMVVMDSLRDIKWFHSINNDDFYSAKIWDSFFAENINMTNIIQKIRQNPELQEVAEVKGAATVSEAYEIKEMLADEIDDGGLYFKFINTGTIDKYKTTWSEGKTQYIKQAYHKPGMDRKLLKDRFIKRYNDSCSEKIIIAGMTKNLECFYDSGEFLAGKSTTLVLNSDLSLKYLVAILNSSLISCFYKVYFNSLSLAGGFYRIGAPQIKQIPIARGSDEEVIKIIELVDEILCAKNKDNSSDTIELESNIDNLIYKIYGLADDEIKIIKEII